MHTCQSIIVLWLWITAYSQYSHAIIQEGPGTDLRMDDFLHLRNLDVLNVTQNGDEDIVHLERRAEECDEDSDCLNYSGWEESGEMNCKDDDQEDDKTEISPAEAAPGSSGPAALVKRGIKDAENICNKGKGGIVMSSPRWPVPDDLEKRFKMVYDIGDPTKPMEPAWYKLTKREERWGKSANGKKRCYDAEHVLEWNVMVEFLKETDDRCEHLQEYFTEQGILGDKITVQKAKEYEKKLAKGDHFDYEDYDYEAGKFKIKEKYAALVQKPRPIDWIAMQWPGGDGKNAQPPTPWTYELVLMTKEFNIKKENVWAGKNILPLPTYAADGKTLKPIQGNDGTIEALWQNKHWKGGKEETWPDNRGKCKAIYMFTTLMALVSYHNDPYIQEVMRAQVTRVGKAFEYLETEVLPKKTTVTGGFKEMKSGSLKDQWIKYMKDLHEKRLKELNRILKEKVEIFKSKKTRSLVRRWDYAGAFWKRASKVEANCGFEKDDKKMEKRVDLMLDAYKNLGDVETELKLD